MNRARGPSSGVGSARRKSGGEIRCTVERGGWTETVVAAVVDRGEPRVVRIACLMLRDALERRGVVAT